MPLTVSGDAAATYGGVSVRSNCRDKMPAPGQFINSKRSLLTGLQTRKFKSKAPADSVSGGHSLAQSWHSPLSSHDGQMGSLGPIL